MPTQRLIAVKEKDTLTVTIPGEIDHHSARTIREEIDRSLFYYRPKELVLNLAEVSFMDSSGLGLILGRMTRMQELGGRLVIADPSRETVKILKLAGLEKVLTFRTSPSKKDENKRRKGD